MSTIQGPLKRIEHPSTLYLEILPRIINHRSGPPDKDPVLRQSDNIRLTLSAFSRTFHLHLNPNEDILHPDAKINYFHLADNGFSTLHHSERLIKDSVMAFQGEVVHGDHTLQRLREDAAGGLDRTFNTPSGSLGWARIVIHHQGNILENIPPVFEGAFSVNGVVHHVLTIENYMRNRHIRDPQPDQNSVDGGLVIFRDFDVIPAGQDPLDDDGDMAYRGSQLCKHDSLDFNRDMIQHPVLRAGAGLYNKPDSWPFAPSWLGESPEAMDDNLHMMLQRGDVGGNISSK